MTGECPRIQIIVGPDQDLVQALALEVGARAAVEVEKPGHAWFSFRRTTQPTPASQAKAGGGASSRHRVSSRLQDGGSPLQVVILHEQVVRVERRDGENADAGLGQR